MKNAGSVDRTARIVLGIAVLSLTVWGPVSLWGLVGLVPIATGIFGYCPLYRLVGLNTCRAARPG